MSRTQNFTRQETPKLCHNTTTPSTATTKPSKMTQRLDLSGTVDEITQQFNRLLKIQPQPKKFITLTSENQAKNPKPQPKPEENSPTDATTPPELIARGPARSERPRSKSQPYIKPSNSPFSNSDSSLGSPPSFCDTNSYSYGGLLTVFPNQITDEDNGLSISPNRKQYMHKNGGEVQIISTNNSNYSRSPTSDYSSYESDVTTDSWCPALVSEDSNSELSSVYGLIEDHTAKGEEVDRKVYDEEIDKILLDLEKSDERESPIPICVFESGKKTRKKSDESVVGVVPPVLSNVVFTGPIVIMDGSLGYVVSSQAPVVGGCGSKFRPIKMKSEVLNGGNIKSKVTIPEFDSNTIRKSILHNYSEKDKRDCQCWASKLRDDELMLGDDDGDRRLHIAISNNEQLQSVCLINVMANLGAENLDVRNNNGETPLFIAASLRQDKLVEYLLAKGANPNESCLNNGETVLHYVSQFGKHFLSVAEVLTRSPDTKIDAFDNLGRTPLIAAIEGHGRQKKIDENQREIIDSLPAVRHLLHHGASVACQDKRSGKTAFHVTIENKCPLILELLCSGSQGINAAVNIANYSGQTPLHYAAVLNNVTESEQIEFVKLLIKAGACSKVSNRENKTAGDLVDRGRDEVKKLLSNRQRRAK
uniref:Uncharacterized protein n=1 Tax=Strigamia maritima TaxID=126957 RepID=T1ITH7_STRMM